MVKVKVYFSKDSAVYLQKHSCNFDWFMMRHPVVLRKSRWPIGTGVKRKSSVGRGNPGVESASGTMFLPGMMICPRMSWNLEVFLPRLCLIIWPNHPSSLEFIPHFYLKGFHISKDAYRLVQLDLTLKCSVCCLISLTNFTLVSLKWHKEYFHFRPRIQLDRPVHSLDGK